jgi:hypothetical protein
LFHPWRRRSYSWLPLAVERVSPIYCLRRLQSIERTRCSFCQSHTHMLLVRVLKSRPRKIAEQRKINKASSQYVCAAAERSTTESLGEALAVWRAPTSGEALAEIAQKSPTTCFYRFLSAPLRAVRMAMMSFNLQYSSSPIPGLRVYMCSKPFHSDRDLAADSSTPEQSRCTTLFRT